MPQPKQLTAYWMEEIIRISEPYTIGKHVWRLVQYRGTENRWVVDETSGVGGFTQVPTIVSDYEWRRLDERFEDWRQARQWPRYDFNNGQTRGLPISLRKLYDACPWAHPPRTDGVTEASPESAEPGSS